LGKKIRNAFLLTLIASVIMLGVPVTRASTIHTSANSAEATGVQPSATAADPPINITVVPHSVTKVSPGQSFNLNISIYNVGNSTVGLGAIQFMLWYNTSLLTAKNTTLQAVATGYLADFGPINVTLGTYTSTSPINNTLGRIYWFADVNVLTNPFKGTGPILGITFNCREVGTCPLSLNDTVLDWIKPVSPFPMGSYVLNKDYGLVNGSVTVTVIPEFPSATLMALLLIITTLTVTFLGKIWSRKRKDAIAAEM
jgi:hypothetical protein